MAQGSLPKKMKLSAGSPVDYTAQVLSPEMAQFAKSLHEVVEAGGELDNLKCVFNSYIQGKTALHKVTEKGDLALVKFLIYNGADTEVKDVKNGRTPLHMATMPKDDGRIL